MKRRFWIAGLALLGQPASAEEVVTVPWREFRELYRGQIERELERARPPAEAPAVCALEEGTYRLAIGATSAAGSAALSGQVVGGKAQPILLFPPDVIIARAGPVKGGMLVRDAGGVAFHPEGPGPFEIAIEFLVAVREDGRSKVVAFPVPAAVRAAIAVTVPAGHRLVSAPGLAGPDGVYHVSPAGLIEVRFDAERAHPPPAATEIDLLTRVELHGKKVVLTTAFLPARAPAGPLTIRLPEGARFIGSSLKGSWIREVSGRAVGVALPPGVAEDFNVQCVLDGEAGERPVALALPGVEGNAGREGEFAVEEPEDAEVTLSGAAAAAPIAPRVADRLRALWGPPPARMMRIPRGGVVQLAARRFESVGTPEVVLDAVRFFTAFEEGGGALSVLHLDVPSGVGPRLRVKRVPEAEIWALSVNGRKAGVYALDAEGWIVPLAAGETSRVELTFLRRGPKLGLQGRVEIALPATGLPARNLHVGIALPPRVELAAVEGDLASDPATAWEVPASLSGTRHFFHRAFDRGEGMTAAFLYKEPVASKERNRP